YDLYPESGVKAQYYISNSASKSDSPEQLKTIGMYLKNIDNLTIEGNGALIMLHGEITSLLADH
ncbi:MAG: alpha-1,3-galactosidase A, partial [Candidatus Nephrothrix sp. EaCA]